MTRPAMMVVVSLAVVAAYANSLPNGFAGDDESIVAGNPVVTRAEWGEALLGPYWRAAPERAGLYRPATVGSFVAEWRLWRGSPLGFHAASVATHAAVSLLVLALLLRLTAPGPALAGAVLFALHPVHVEAVANIVGRSEVYAALAVLAACLLWVVGASWTGWRRDARTAGLAGLYLVGLASKETAVTLPAVLLLLEAARPSNGSARERLGRQAPAFLTLGATLVGYLLVRTAVLGSPIGAGAAPWLRGLPASARVLTALSFWPHYLRLAIAPMDLVSDYSPGVLTLRYAPDAAVVAGAVILAASLAGSVALRRRASLIALGLAWFVVTTLPVSNLLFPVGTLVAERTLYLPSVGVSLALAGALAAMPAPLPALRLRILAACGLVLGGAYLWRTVTRNPSWRSTSTVAATLGREHPESYGALSELAAGLSRARRPQEAATVYERALALAPGLYGLTLAVADAELHAGHSAREEELLRVAVALRPEQPQAYRLLGDHLLRAGRGREAHAVALEGIARAGLDARLWGVVSEAYVLRGDLEASARARRAALSLEPGSARGWARLADILDATHRGAEADEARARALEAAQPALERAGGR